MNSVKSKIRKARGVYVAVTGTHDVHYFKVTKHEAEFMLVKCKIQDLQVEMHVSGDLYIEHLI